MLLRLLSACVVALHLLPAEAAPAAPLKPLRSVEGISEYQLPNGLQVLLAPDDSKPTTTVNVTYRVGSRMENYGETGMAHLLEHLLFKGTPTNRNVWAEFTRRGLRANGSTWLDRTNYFASFAANEDNLKWYLSWQADAMVNSFIARKDLDSEMTVVRNEMEMGENSPSRILFEKTLAAMYQWHNYGKSTIGARADVENVDIGRLQAFYRLYYQPDNATLIVSGKFEPVQALRWIQDSFGKIAKPKRTLPALYTIDPAQDGERAVTLRRVGGATLMMSAYHVPPGAHPDFAAVELLALILGDTPSGRLHKRLVEKQLAAVRAFAALPESPALAAANKRVGNILKKAELEGPVDAHVNPALLQEKAEQDLFAALQRFVPEANAQFDAGDYTASLQTLAVLRAPVDAFFDDVMVNAEQLDLRLNRQGLLKSLHEAMNRVADLSRLAV